MEKIQNNDIALSWLDNNILQRWGQNNFLLYIQLVEANKSVPKANTSYLEYEFFHEEMSA